MYLFESLRDGKAYNDYSNKCIVWSVVIIGCVYSYFIGICTTYIIYMYKNVYLHKNMKVVRKIERGYE